MQDYEDAKSWPYLDKLICAWRLEEEKVRKACGLPPAEPYGRCQLFRNQEPTEAWLEEAGLLTPAPTKAPVPPPTNAPIPRPTKAPTDIPTVAPTAVETQTTLEVPTPADAQDPKGFFSGFNFGLSNALGLVFGGTAGFGSPFSGVDETFDKEELTPAPAPTPAAPRPAAINLSGPQVLSPNFGSVTNAEEEVDAPVVEDKIETTPAIPPEIDCSAFNANYGRMCSSTAPCCEATREDSSFCWDIYDNIFPGDLIYSACYHCCNEPKEVGPPAPVKDDLPKTIQCSDYNTQRICRTDNGCCGNPRSGSGYCESQYATLGGAIDEVCVSPVVDRTMEYSTTRPSHIFFLSGTAAKSLPKSVRHAVDATCANPTRTKR